MTKKEIEIMEKIQKYKHVVKILNYVFNVEQDTALSQIFVVMELANCTLQDQLVMKKSAGQVFTNEEMLKMMTDLIDSLTKLQEKVK